MGYQFKLESLLKIRHFEEERLQKEFADAKLSVDVALNKLTELFDLQKKSEVDFHQMQMVSTTGPESIMFRTFLNGISTHIEHQKGLIDQAETVCNQKREALMEAIKKRKVIEKLKEKGNDAHLEKMKQEETKFIDEMAISRFTFKRD